MVQMLTNTSDKIQDSNVSNLLESLIEDYVTQNEIYDWSIEDDESYTVYNVKSDEDVCTGILLLGVAKFLSAGLNASLFEESDFIVTRMLDYEKRYVSALAETTLYEHLLENADPDTDPKYDIYCAKHTQAEDRLEFSRLQIESLSENIF